MGIINVLPKNIAELIAAGEVIERPSSVIKELVENSIDACSESITVEIQNGGTTFMRVSDDGCGIRAEDVRQAFLRHATSKISVKDDLDAIGTLGFRGEALASICAVSKVEILTKHYEEPNGVHYCIEGSEEKLSEEIGCPQGTTFIVRDIFYNVPARMKFLKRDISEGNAVSALMDRIALSHPEISFTFIRDGKQIMKTQGDGKLENAVYQVFGRQFFDNLMPVSYERNNIKVEGFVTKPTASVKANRSMQMFYINGRYVRSKTAMAAVEQAYRGSIMVGKYPSCVLMLTMNCSMLDVNVHPAKLEVRFTNEAPVYEAVYHGVKSAIMQYDTRNEEELFGKKPQYTEPQLLIPPVDKASQLGFSYGIQKAERKFEAGSFFGNLPDAMKNRPSAMRNEELARLKELSSRTDPKPIVHTDDGSGAEKIKTEELYISDLSELFRKEASEQKTEEKVPETVVTQVDEEDEDEELILNFPLKKSAEEKQTEENEDKEQAQEAEEEDSLTDELPVQTAKVSEQPVSIVDEEKREKPIRYIGEIFSTYIIIEYGSDRVMFIDKHAAHERLIYERLKGRQTGLTPQLLLEPVSVTLEKEEAQTVLENRDMLLEAGFEVDCFGERTILIRSVPVMMETIDITESFEEIADYLCRHKKLVLSEKMEWIYANTACRAAIKGGNKSHPQELIELVITLENNPEIRCCPHGRPIYFFMKKYDIEKMFGRLG